MQEVQCGDCGAKNTVIINPWMHGNYAYWTMTEKNSSDVLYISGAGQLTVLGPDTALSVRPVLELNKSADITKLAS